MPGSHGRPANRKPKGKAVNQKDRTAPAAESPSTSPSPAATSRRPARASSADVLLRTLGRTLRRLYGWLLQILLWASVTMTLVAGIFYFLPRVTVDPPAPYDPANPTPVIFTIANTNIVPLRDVAPGIGICFIRGKNSVNMISEDKNCGNGPAKSILLFEPWHLKWLDVDEKHQLPIEEALKVGPREQIEDANITIVIAYTPWRMPSFWRNTKQFRFVTKKLSDGRIYWTPVPINR